jgi:hypothetical protein
VTGPESNTIIPKAVISSSPTIVGFKNPNKPSAQILTVSDESGVISSLQVIQTDTVTLYASTTWYGIVHRDSLLVTVIDPLQASITIIEQTPRGSVTPVPVFAVSNLTIAAGAVVQWNNNTRSPVSVIFENPADAEAVPDALNSQLACAVVGVVLGQGGNMQIGPVPTPLPINPSLDDQFMYFKTRCQSYDLRYFPVPGTYRFHTETGATGTLIVR